MIAAGHRTRTALEIFIELLYEQFTDGDRRYMDTAILFDHVIPLLPRRARSSGRKLANRVNRFCMSANPDEQFDRAREIIRFATLNRTP